MQHFEREVEKESDRDDGIQEAEKKVGRTFFSFSLIDFLAKHDVSTSFRYLYRLPILHLIYKCP